MIPFYGDAQQKSKQVKYFFHDPLLTPYRANMDVVHAYAYDVLDYVTLHGVRIDTKALRALMLRLGRQQRQAEKKLAALGVERINPYSTIQVRKLFFETLGLPVQRLTDTGLPATDTETLQRLHHPVVAPFIALKNAVRQHRSYERIRDSIRSNGRVHIPYQINIAGRMVARSAFLQTLEARQVFRASEGYTLVTASYKNLEFRILSSLSGVEAMRELCADGRDIHTLTAAKMLRVPFEKVTAEQRQVGKLINYSMSPWVTAESIAVQAGISVSEASRLRYEYEESMPGLHEYTFKVKEGVLSRITKELCGCLHTKVATYFGSERSFHFSNPEDMAQIREQALNHVVLGTAADVMQIAVLRVAAMLGHIQGNLLVVTPDALVMEVPVGTEFEPELRAAMCPSIEGFLPLEVDIWNTE